VRGFIDRVADGVAVILLEGGGRASLPAAALPGDLAAGTVIQVTMQRLPAPTDAGAAHEMADLIARLRAGEHRHG
jgi:hypothetical protein